MKRTSLLCVHFGAEIQREKRSHVERKRPKVKEEVHMGLHPLSMQPISRLNSAVICL